MLGSLLLAAFAGTLFVLGAPSNSTTDANWGCGTYVNETRLIAAEQEISATQKFNSTADLLAQAAIPVYFHIISYDGTPAGGNVYESQLDDQIAMLNFGYASAGLTFYRARTDRVMDPYWMTMYPESQVEAAMKRYFRSGGPADLHIYTVGSIQTPEGPLAGFSTFPWEYNSKPILDGVVLDFHALPGGTLPGQNTGKIGIHEVGHWTGLLHTFQGGCFPPGDYVADTPPEASPATGCPVYRDTCYGDGPDPIHNYMDYVDATCMIEFTYGQVSRLRQQLNYYRGIF